MKSLLGVCIAAVAAGVAVAEDLVWDVPTGTTSNVTEIIPAGTYTITKKGGGKVFYCPSDLTKTNTVPNFTGAWVIEEGTLHTPYLGNMGKPKTLTVEKGGAFDFSGLTAKQPPTAGKFNDAKTIVTIAGDGVNGGGALVYSQGSGSDYLFRRLILSDDATVSLGGRFGVTADYVDLNGHALTKIGDAVLIFRDKISVTNENGAAIVLKKNMNLQEIRAAGDATGKIVFEGGKLNPHKIPADCPVPWTLYAETAAGASKTNVINIEVGDTRPERIDQYNYFSGPVVAKGASYVNIATSAAPAAPLNFTGDVESDSMLQKYSQGCLRFFGSVTVTNSTTIQQNNAGYLRFAPAAGKQVQLQRLDVRTTTVLDQRNTDKPTTVRYVNANSGIFMAGNPSFAQTYVRGGEVRTDKIDFGRLGRQELTIMDGAKVGTNTASTMTFYMGYANAVQPAPLRCFPTLNVIGAGSKLDVGMGEVGPNRPGDTLAMVNIADGGCLCSRYLRRRWVKDEDTTSLVIVNFDGGTYVANTNGYVSGALSLASRYHPDACTIYEGGLTVDTSRASKFAGTVTTISFPLRHPEGKGLKAINIADIYEFTTNQYGRIPFVEFSGAGSNAYAFVEVDEETRKPTNVRIVSRGSGFDATSRVMISNAYNKATFTFTPELYDYPPPTDVAWKGLTKVGEGELQLQTTNYYYGPTVVMQGQLNLMGSARPIDSGIVVSNNATVSFTAKNESAREIPFVAGSGTLSNYTNPGLTVRKLILSAREGLAGHVLTFSGKVILPEGASVEIVDTEVLDSAAVRSFELCTSAGLTGTATLPEISEDWKVRRTAKGFRISRQEGVILLVR